MKSFLKFLVLTALAANMVFLFVLGGRIPEGISLPFGLSMPETEEEEEMTADVPAEAEKEKAEEVKEEESGTEAAKKDRKAGQEPAKDQEEGIRTEEMTGEEEKETLSSCRIISDSGSNIRSGPGLDYEVILSYPYDTVLLVRGEAQDGWYPILAEDGTEGYIFETQIELLREPVPAADGLQAEGQMQ